jgi:predicted DCC family thiol-disulfide oxidoreductase YuxK
LSLIAIYGLLVMGDSTIRLSEPDKVPRVATSGLLGPGRTDPPGRYVLLYDGSCRFCTAQSQNLIALARRGVVEAVDFQQPGVLARFPGISHEACMQAMHLVSPDGRIYKGFEAAVRAVATRPVLGTIAYLYYLPGLRHVIDWLYAFVAGRRYRLFGGNAVNSNCDGGTCKLHGR